MSTPIRPFRFSAAANPAYYAAPVASQGNAYQSQAVPQPGPPAAPSMDRLKRELGGMVLNASRTPLDPNQLYGLQEDQPVTPVARHSIPDTGMEKLDHAIEQTLATTGEVASFAPQAAINTASDTFRGATVGGVGAFLLSAVGSGIATAVKKEFTSGNAAATTLCLTILGSFIGGGIGLGQSCFENLRDLKRLLTGPRLP